jgi:predicted HD phosphohydrolase
MHATFTRMTDSTGADWRTIVGEFMPYTRSLPDRMMAHLQLLQGDYGGFPIDRYTHCLQTATLAHFEPMLRRLMAQPRQSLYKAALDAHSS